MFQQQRDGEVHTFLIVSVNSCGTLYFTRMGSCLDIDLLFILSSSLVTLIDHSPDSPLPFSPSASHSWLLLSSHCWLLADPCLGWFGLQATCF